MTGPLTDSAPTTGNWELAYRLWDRVSAHLGEQLRVMRGPLGSDQEPHLSLKDALNPGMSLDPQGGPAPQGAPR